MLKTLRLSLKFTVILGIVFLCGIVLSGALLARTIHQKAQAQVTDQAIVLMELINSVRDYTSGEIKPLISSRSAATNELILQTIPAYSARRVFENLQKSLTYKNYSYKEATLNPTNLRDRADEFEAALIQQFRQQATRSAVGFRQVGGESLFYVARPLRVDDPSCLVCHSTPQAAPKEQISTYGAQHGFGWKLHDVIGAQTVYVPSKEVFESFYQQLWVMLAAFITVFAIVLLVLNALLRRTVIQPILPMARLAKKISSDQLSSDTAEESDLRKLDKVARRSDELGQLAALFRQMTAVISDREQSLKQLVQNLRQETNSAKKGAIAHQIGSSLSPQDLLRQAKQIRLSAESQRLNLAEVLRQVPYFQPCTSATLQAVIQAGQPKTVAAGAFVCREGAYSDALYVLLAGRAEVLTSQSSQRLHLLACGEVVGDFSILLNIPCITSVRAIEDAVVFALDRTQLRTLFTNYPALVEQTAQGLNQRNAELERRQSLLRRQGLLSDETAFTSDSLGWIRRRLATGFGLSLTAS